MKKKITLFSEFLGIEKLLTEIEWKGAERENINFFNFSKIYGLLPFYITLMLIHVAIFTNSNIVLLLCAESFR